MIKRERERERGREREREKEKEIDARTVTGTDRWTTTQGYKHG